jgi:hypothetical protein
MKGFTLGYHPFVMKFLEIAADHRMFNAAIKDYYKYLVHNIRLLNDNSATPLWIHVPQTIIHNKLRQIYVKDTFQKDCRNQSSATLKVEKSMMRYYVILYLTS